MFFIVCVVYNRLVEEIRSLSQFVSLADAHGDVRVLIYDNSTKEDLVRANGANLHAKEIIYYSCNENAGLSGAYNRALKEVNGAGWILWADDDTWFSEEYLENVYEKTRTTQAQIVSGIVKTNTGSILSPIFRGAQNVGEIVHDNVYRDVYCINSGLCVSSSVYTVIGCYDEKLFVDMIDYWLFDELHKKQLDIVEIVAGEISQSFSGTSSQALSVKMKRFKMFSKDFKYYCSVEKKGIIYKYKVLVKRLASILLGCLKG